MTLNKLAFLTLAMTMAQPSMGETRADLEAEIASLKQKIVVERPVVDGLTQPWLKTASFNFSFAAAPIISLIQQLNTLPDSERTINLGVTASNGQLWGWDADCYALGKKYSDEGAYVEFQDPNYRVEARVHLSNFGATWSAAQGMDFGVDAAGHLGIGTLHWHRKPCVGGGVGGSAGPATCDAQARLAAIAGFSLDADRVLRYSSSLNLNNIRYGCSISCGDAGDFRIDGLAPSPSAVAMNGAIPLPVSTGGSITNPDPKVTLPKEYEIRLISPSVQMTEEGVDIVSNFQVVWR